MVWSNVPFLLDRISTTMAIHDLLALLCTPVVPGVLYYYCYTSITACRMHL